MIVSLSPPGVKCQVGDFVMLVDPAVGKKASLILRTQTELPIEFPLPPEIVAGPGEYEISGVRVKGIGLDGETNNRLLRTVYSAELEGIRLAFLGELSDEPIGQALGKLGAVDILFLSVESGKLSTKGGSLSVRQAGAPGGKAKQLTSLVKQVDPKIIIPIGDKTVKLLAEELGQKVQAEEKIIIKKKDLEKEQIASKLVWLKS